MYYTSQEKYTTKKFIMWPVYLHNTELHKTIIKGQGGSKGKILHNTFIIK